MLGDCDGDGVGFLFIYFLFYFFLFFFLGGGVVCMCVCFVVVVVVFESGWVFIGVVVYQKSKNFYDVVIFPFKASYAIHIEVCCLKCM